MQQEYGEDEVLGEPIESKLADLFLIMAKGKMSDEVLKQKQDKYKNPQNCDLKVPRVNSEIWSVLDTGERSSDLKKQKTQKTLIKGIIAIVLACNDCSKIENKGCKTMIKPLIEAVGLLMKANHELAVDRRTSVLNAQNINSKFKKLASDDVPITDLLFGNDLKESVQADFVPFV